MKNYLTNLAKNKNLRFALPIFIIVFFLYQEIQSLALNYSPDSTHFIQVTHSESKTVKANPTIIDISKVSIDQLKTFANNDYNSPTFEQNGITYQASYGNKEISHLQFSPDKKKMGFYVHYPQEGRILDKASLIIMNVKERNFKKISEGVLKVSNWEWGNNSQVIIYINCGSSCHLAHIRSITNGELLAEYLDK